MYRQGIGNPLDLVFGLLDGVLSYSAVLRTIVFYSLGVSFLKLFKKKLIFFYKIGIWNNHFLVDHVNIAKQSSRQKKTKCQEEKCFLR